MDRQPKIFKSQLISQLHMLLINDILHDSIHDSIFTTLDVQLNLINLK